MIWKTSGISLVVPESSYESFFSFLPFGASEQKTVDNVKKNVAEHVKKKFHGRLENVNKTDSLHKATRYQNRPAGHDKEGSLEPRKRKKRLGSRAENVKNQLRKRLAHMEEKT